MNGRDTKIKPNILINKFLILSPFIALGKYAIPNAKEINIKNFESKIIIPKDERDNFERE